MEKTMRIIKNTLLICAMTILQVRSAEGPQSSAAFSETEANIFKCITNFLSGRDALVNFESQVRKGMSYVMCSKSNRVWLQLTADFYLDYLGRELSSVSTKFDLVFECLKHLPCCNGQTPIHQHPPVCQEEIEDWQDFFERLDKTKEQDIVNDWCHVKRQGLSIIERIFQGYQDFEKHQKVCITTLISLRTHNAVISPKVISHLDQYLVAVARVKRPLASLLDFLRRS